jgi:hypothetical protein
MGPISFVSVLICSGCRGDSYFFLKELIPFFLLVVVRLKSDVAGRINKMYINYAVAFNKNEMNQDLRSENLLEIDLSSLKWRMCS